MVLTSKKNEEQGAFERGRQSVRDGTVGNPYVLDSMLYTKFDEGVLVRLSAKTIGRWGKWVSYISFNE